LLQPSKEGVRNRRRSQRDDDDDEDDDLAAVNQRLDQLTRQLERIAQGGASARPDADDRSSDRVSEALAKLDRRLEQVIGESRSAAREQERRARAMPPSPPAPQPGPANWAAEISARQRTLDGGAAAAPPPTAWTAGPDVSGLEQQLRDITTQIASLHQPYEDALTGLRGDLAEIGRTLTEAMPRRAIEALEAEVRALAERFDRSRQAGADAANLSSLERGLAEVRDALKRLTPAESLVGFEDAVRALSHKIDQIGAVAHEPGAQDPLAFKQLEQAVVSLRGVVANVASDGAL
jgi:localization factor PodJL